jgi:hypothetical protein
MTLLNAPAYDAAADLRKRNILIASAITFFVLLVIFFAGYLSGHGWFFSDLPAEHKVNTFFNALQDKDYSKAYSIYQNDPNFAQHPDKYSGYSLKDFTNDWTTDPRNFYPITSHHVDISKTDGHGFFGTGIIVAVRVNGDHKLFMYVNRADGTMTWPAPHEIGYE